MELNLASSTARNRNSTHGRPRLEAFCGDIRLRETRCSYFLNLILQGLRTDEIEVEMDKERSVILRGESYCKEVGMLKRRWRLMATDAPTRKRRPFKIPDGVNVGATRGSFDRHILHLVMPKFRQSRFRGYHVIHVHSSHRHHTQNGNAHESQGAAKVDHSYTSEITGKDTICSTSCLSNSQEKMQQYRRTRRRVNKVAVKSQNVDST